MFSLQKPNITYKEKCIYLFIPLKDWMGNTWKELETETEK